MRWSYTAFLSLPGVSVFTVKRLLGSDRLSFSSTSGSLVCKDFIRSIFPPDIIVWFLTRAINIWIWLPTHTRKNKTHKDNISTWNISYLFGTLPSPYRVSKAAQHIIKSSNIFAVADINNNLKEDDLIMQIYFSRITRNLSE